MCKFIEIYKYIAAALALHDFLQIENPEDPNSTSIIMPTRKVNCQVFPPNSKKKFCSLKCVIF